MKSLEQTVIEFQAAGKDWIDAKLRADQLEEDQKSYLASLINEIDDNETSETKLERKARGSKQYRDYITAMCLARAEMLKKKVRFDALGMLFSARQSDRAYERETIKKGIFSEGGR
jgi:hypothetical protein